MFHLPVVIERLEETRQHIRAFLQQQIINRLETDDAADAALTRSLQAKQGHKIRRQIGRVVDVIALLGMGLRRADAGAGARLFAGIDDVVDHRPIPFLGDRAAEHGHQQPMKPRSGFRFQPIDWQAVDNGETNPGAGLLKHLGHQGPTRRHLKIAGVERERRKRIGLDLSRRAIQLGDAITVELDKPIILQQRLRRPCHRA